MHRSRTQRAGTLRMDLPDTHVRPYRNLLKWTYGLGQCIIPDSRLVYDQAIKPIGEHLPISWSNSTTVNRHYPLLCPSRLSSHESTFPRYEIRNYDLTYVPCAKICSIR